MRFYKTCGILLAIISIFNCSFMSPSLTIETRNIDDKDGRGVPNLQVTVEQIKDGTQYEETTDEYGIIKFPQIKSPKFILKVDGQGEYFPIDTALSLASLKSPYLLELEELKTVIVGYVLEDSTFKGIDSCVIQTEPFTSSTMTNSSGKYVLKSKLFTHTPYTFKAMHGDYLPGDIKSIKLNINEVNIVPKVMLQPKQRIDFIDPTKIINNDPEPRGGGTLLDRKKK